MISWADAHKKIGKSSHEFNLLQNKFNTFFTHVESQVNDSSLKSSEITVSKCNNNLFISNFVGRDLTFVFTTMLNGSGTLAGRVSCYMACKFPEEKLILIDSFDFSTSGKTTLIIEEFDNGDPAQLDHDAHALCIFLGVLCKSLSY